MKMLKTLRTLIIIAACMSVTQIAAATIKQREITVGDVHEHWIIIKGMIEQGDTVGLLSALGETKDRAVTVWLDSPGGNVAEGLAMARMIKSLGMNTYVHSDGKCDSICSIMFLSGKRKMVTASSRVGVHTAHDSKTKKADAYANAVIGWYLGSLDYPEELVDIWAKTKPDQLVNLNDGPNSNLRLGIETVQPVEIPILDRLLSD
jgi:hypothetical protein